MRACHCAVDMRLAIPLCVVPADPALSLATRAGWVNLPGRGWVLSLLPGHLRSLGQLAWEGLGLVLNPGHPRRLGQLPGEGRDRGAQDVRRLRPQQRAGRPGAPLPKP